MTDKDRGYVLFHPDKESVSVFGGQSCCGEKEKKEGIQKSEKMDKCSLEAKTVFVYCFSFPLHKGRHCLLRNEIKIFASKKLHLFRFVKENFILVRTYPFSKTEWIYSPRNLWFRTWLFSVFGLLIYTRSSVWMVRSLTIHEVFFFSILIFLSFPLFLK